MNITSSINNLDKKLPAKRNVTDNSPLAWNVRQKNNNTRPRYRRCTQFNAVKKR
jgi:hypothetical protein